MTDFTSPIVLGDSYTDQRTGLIGHATTIAFSEEGCIDVRLEYADTTPGGAVELRNAMVNELRLTRTDGKSHGEPVTYVSDVTLGRKYRDATTKLKGWAASIEFWEQMATRVILRSVGKDKGGIRVLKYHAIDDFHLVDSITKVQCRRANDLRSPIAREITR